MTSSAARPSRRSQSAEPRSWSWERRPSWLGRPEPGSPVGPRRASRAWARGRGRRCRGGGRRGRRRWWRRRRRCRRANERCLLGRDRCGGGGMVGGDQDVVADPECRWGLALAPAHLVHLGVVVRMRTAHDRLGVLEVRRFRFLVRRRGDRRLLHARHRAHPVARRARRVVARRRHRPHGAACSAAGCPAATTSPAGAGDRGRGCGTRHGGGVRVDRGGRLGVDGGHRVGVRVGEGSGVRVDRRSKGRRGSRPRRRGRRWRCRWRLGLAYRRRLTGVVRMDRDGVAHAVGHRHLARSLVEHEELRVPVRVRAAQHPLGVLSELRRHLGVGDGDRPVSYGRVRGSVVVGMDGEVVAGAKNRRSVALSARDPPRLLVPLRIQAAEHVSGMGFERRRGFFVARRDRLVLRRRKADELRQGFFVRREALRRGSCGLGSAARARAGRRRADGRGAPKGSGIGADGFGARHPCVDGGGARPR